MGHPNIALHAGSGTRAHREKRQSRKAAKPQSRHGTLKPQSRLAHTHTYSIHSTACWLAHTHTFMVYIHFTACRLKYTHTHIRDTSQHADWHTYIHSTPQHAEWHTSTHTHLHSMPIGTHTHSIYTPHSMPIGIHLHYTLHHANWHTPFFGAFTSYLYIYT